MVVRTTTPSVNPHCLHCGYKILCHYWFRDSGSLYVLFLVQSEIWRYHRLLVLRKPRAGFYLVTQSWEVNGGMPGYRERTGKPLVIFLSLSLSLSFFTIRSGSAAFSAMTWDLLRFHSFLLNLLIRFSLSSLRDRSSTLAPDEALRSRSGSRIDLSVKNTDKWQNTDSQTWLHKDQGRWLFNLILTSLPSQVLNLNVQLPNEHLMHVQK